MSHSSSAVVLALGSPLVPSIAVVVPPIEVSEFRNISIYLHPSLVEYTGQVAFAAVTFLIHRRTPATSPLAVTHPFPCPFPYRAVPESCHHPSATSLVDRESDPELVPVLVEFLAVPQLAAHLVVQERPLAIDLGLVQSYLNQFVFNLLLAQLTKLYNLIYHQINSNQNVN